MEDGEVVLGFYDSRSETKWIRSSAMRETHLRHRPQHHDSHAAIDKVFSILSTIA